MKITITHPELNKQKTYLTAEAAVSATTSTVENNDGFATDDYVLFGKYGQEKTEIVTLTSTTGNTTLGHTNGPVFAHPARTPIYQMSYNQAEIYRATAEGGTYALVTTVNLDVDEEYTLYNDTNGSSTSWYKIRYKNATAGTYSSYSDEVQGTGFADDSLGSMTDEVLLNFGDPDSKEVSRDQVRNHLNAGVRKLVMQMIRTFPDYFGTYTTQALTASTTYNYPTRFISFMRVQVGSSVTDSYNVEFKKESELDPTWTYVETDPKIVMRATTWKTYPDCAGKTAYIWYWQYPASMTDDNDQHALPYGGRDVLVSYALYKVWLNKDIEKANAAKKIYDEQLKEYIDFVGQSRQASNNTFQRLTFGEEDYVY